MDRSKLKKIFLIIIIFLIFILIKNELYPQQIEAHSTTSKFLENVKLWRQDGHISHFHFENQPKCAMGLIFDIIKHSQFLNKIEKNYLSELLEPPLRQKFRSSGNFTVHYDTIGYHTPSLLTSQFKRMLGDTNVVKTHQDSMVVIESYVDSVLYYFNLVWNQVVNVYQYLPPPFEPGYTKYNLYITELGSGLYGQTIPSINPINPGQPPYRYYTYIEIDNDFISVYPTSRGIAGLKVTAAHEFHHAVQLGSYGYREFDRYFYEITSTWVEDLIFDEVNDYYQYIKTPQNTPRGHFATPEISLISTDGLIEYSRAILGKFLQEKFSPSVMKNTWDLFKSQIPFQVASIYALNQALIRENSSLRLAFVEFAEWNYFTGERAKELGTYKEAKFYPLIKSKTQLEVPNSGRTIIDSLQNLSTIYQPIKYNNATSTIIINNLNYEATLLGNQKYFKFTLNLTSTGNANYKQVLPNLYAKLITNDIENWNFGSLDQTITANVFAYPNPFLIGEGGTVKFIIPENNTDVDLLIYNSDMNLIYKNQYILTPYTKYIEWNAKNNNGEFVSSGIYIFVISTKTKDFIGKLAIIQK